MIQIIYAPGCYGTFLARCLYTFTDLSDDGSHSNVDVEFAFDTNGSSHIFRKNINSRGRLIYTHLPLMQYLETDQYITLIPCSKNFLDYFDNQFAKQEKQQIVSYIQSIFSPEEIHQKLANGWNYMKPLETTTPRWILREWCSLWIEDFFSSCYAVGSYSALPALVQISTQKLFADLSEVVGQIADTLGLKLLVSSTQIEAIQKQFVSAQPYHDIQNRCDIWVERLLQGYNDPTPCLTLFDEAWVQHRLRLLGYEIQCDGLINFPRNAKDLSVIIYENDKS